MDYALSSSLRQLRLEWQMKYAKFDTAKLLGIDTAHEYMIMVIKGFSANKMEKTTHARS